MNPRKLAENALGKPLPLGAQVHHLVIGDVETLVLCPDAAYHMLLERRGRAYRASGNASWLKCIYCKNYDDRKRLRIPKAKSGPDKGSLRETWAYHVTCAAKNRAKYQK